MDFKQSTIGDIIESERQMVLTAPERYGAYYSHALDASIFLSLFVKSLDAKLAIFGRFLSQVKKHHTLAVFSTVRLHQVQAMMNLRQVLEAGACAAFAIAHPDPAHFADMTPEGILDPNKKLTEKRYKWLDDNFPAGSTYIKDMKGRINKSTAHANIVYTHNNFRPTENGAKFSAPFFDIEDAYFIYTDLWMCGSIALSLMDLFYGVNNTVKNAIEFTDDFHQQFSTLEQQNKSLNEEMKSTERFKNTEAKFAHLIKP